MPDSRLSLYYLVRRRCSIRTKVVISGDARTVLRATAAPGIGASSREIPFRRDRRHLTAIEHTIAMQSPRQNRRRGDEIHRALRIVFVDRFGPHRSTRL